MKSGARGFALVAAIFLLVVLGALGAYMVSIFATQQAGHALDIQGARAYQAARAGIEWGMWQIMKPENTNPATAPYNTQYGCAGSPTTLAALSATELAGFTVVVECNFTDHTDAGVIRRLYALRSTARWGAAPANVDYVERQVVASVSTCRRAANDASC